MSMRDVTLHELSCDHCPALVLVRFWQDAQLRGWLLKEEGVWACPECAKKQPKEMSEADWKAELETARSSELLRAAQLAYKNSTGPDTAPWFLLALGFDIALEGGWRRIGWRWLRDLRTQEKEQKDSKNPLTSE